MATGNRKSSKNKTGSGARTKSAGRSSNHHTTGQRMTKKERMEQMAKAEAFRTEVILWVIVAVSLLLFVSNLGFGGVV